MSFTVGFPSGETLIFKNRDDAKLFLEPIATISKGARTADEAAPETCLWRNG